MKRLVLMAIPLLLLTSCGDARRAEDNGKLNVCASFYAMYDFARTVGGDDINLYNMTPSGAEPHDYEPTAADMALLSEADVFIYHGNGIDGWAEEIIDTLPETVTAVRAPGLIQTYYPDDPHTWLSPINASLELKAICAALSAADPANAEKYSGRADEYNAQILALDGEYKSAGFAGTDLFTAHGAYGYLCDELGMTQTALESASGESDPSPARMAELVKELKAKNARCVFYDPTEKSKLADAAAAEAGITTEPLSTFENDAADRDYVTVMKENLEQMKKLLGDGE